MDGLQPAQPVTQTDKRTFSIELAYNGAAFFGWQMQPGTRTVQGEVRSWVEQILNQPVNLVGAGRTDRGVHAMASLATFEASTAMQPIRLEKALRRVLPQDIFVRAVRERPMGFSARFSARAREYEYRMHLGPDPFQLGLAWCLGYRHLDVERMRRSLEPLKGRLDCRAFCISKSLPPTAWCDFHHIGLEEVGGSGESALHFVVRCDRFLHSMVRSLVGTLVDVGRGRLEEGIFAELIATGDRSRIGVTAPPEGLYLRRVYYEDFVTGDSFDAVEAAPTAPPSQG